MNSQYIHSLKALKEKLNSRELSALVGAGFSKNVNNLFPTWWELLLDMAKAIYESDIKREYNLSTNAATVLPYEEYLNERLEEKIKNNGGYLKLVSQYIQQNGYREIVESYIEERTPFLISRQEENILRYKNGNSFKEIKLKKDDLRLHEKLLDLPWNNIFTTNYDNLLEKSSDRLIQKEVEDKIKAIEEENDEAQLFIDLNNEKIKEIEEKYNENSSGFPSIEDNSISNLNVDNSSKNEDKQKLFEQTFKYNWENGSQENRIKNNNATIEQLKNISKECYSVITSSPQLALKRSRNIIKLHGNMREDGDEEIGFDNDVKKHYIISDEDYITYPNTHEAFTQLMRISLLQDSFCLIGFSGIDPNFLAWIGWVRDIVLRDKQSNKGEDKIYLIEMTDIDPSNDKKLLYKNHRIAHLPLLKDEIINFISSEVGRNVIDRKNKKEILLLLMNYFKADVVATPKLMLERLRQKEYNDLWNRRPVYDSRTFNVSETLTILPLLTKYKKYSRFPLIDFSYSNNKEDLLYFVEPINKKAIEEEKQNEIIELFLLAIQDLFLPYKIHSDKLDTIFSANQLSNDAVNGILLQKLINYVWENDTLNIKRIIDKIESKNTSLLQEAHYYTCLMYAFNLDFDKLCFSLEKWIPEPQWAVKKAGLQAWINIDESIGLLKSSDQDIAQEELYSLDLLAYLEKSKSHESNKLSLKKVNQYKNIGFKTLDDNIDYLLEEINKIVKEINPYGDSKFTVGKPIIWTKINPVRMSIQFIGILIESGYPLALPNVHYRSHKETYNVFAKCFEYYPFPALYYALQYTNEKFIRRIGQDYAYSDNLISELPIIANNIQVAYNSKNIPPNYKINILRFYAEILISLPSDVWQSFYMIVWNKELTNNSLFYDVRYEENVFIINGLGYIRDAVAIRKIILDCFKNLNQQNKDTSILYLHRLASNVYVKEYFHQILNTTLTKAINDVIKQIDTQNIIYLFALGNINELLTDKQKEQIAQKISELQFAEIENVRIWSVILFFIGKNNRVVREIKKAIINHKNLWYSGIDDEGAAHRPYDFISIFNISKRIRNRDGLVWTNSEAIAIFERLQLEFNKIKTFINNRPGVEIEFINILEQMLFFLESQGDKIDKNKKIYNEISAVYIKQKGYKKIEEGLVSTEQSEIIWALNELSKEIYDDNSIGVSNKLFTLVLNKLYLKSSPGLAASLGYISDWIRDCMNISSAREYSNILINIIRKYDEEKELPLDIDKPYIKEKLITISYTLFTFGFKDSIIIKYVDELENSRFNNIRYNLKYKLTKKK